MRETRITLGCAVALCLGACGSASFGDVPVATSEAAVLESVEETIEETIEDLLRSARVSKSWQGFSDLTGDELRAIVGRARDANPGVGIREIHQRHGFHSSDHLVRVVYEAHEVTHRIRHYRSLSLERKVELGDGAGGERTILWQPDGAERGLVLNQEVCPPWRSFRVGNPPLDSEIVDLWSAVYLLSDVDEAYVLDFVDAVRSEIPPGERLFWISKCSNRDQELDEAMGRHWPSGAEVYDVHSVRGCSAGGAAMRVVHVNGRWTAEGGGQWIS